MKEKDSRPLTRKEFYDYCCQVLLPRIELIFDKHADRIFTEPDKQLNKQIK